MRKALLILLSLIIMQPAVFSANKKMIPSTGGENDLPNIFIYAIPEDNETELKEYKEENTFTQTNFENDEITLEFEEDSTVLGATVLKGYAQYLDDSSVIHLKDDNDNFVLNIKTPQKISGTKGLNLSTNTQIPQRQYKAAEYAIAPGSVKTSSKTGDFTIGALYNTEVDNIAMLEEETGLFTKYEKSRFALSSAFKKSLNTTYAQDYNTVSITPEFKLNNHLSLKNVLSADITRNRRSSKLVFSVNPLKDTDRFLLELGAKQTVYMDTDFTKTEFSFSTNFKL